MGYRNEGAYINECNMQTGTLNVRYEDTCIPNIQISIESGIQLFAPYNPHPPSNSVF